MVFLRLNLLLVLIQLIPALAFAETLYKCSKDGVLVFSDQPCQGQQLEAESISSPAPASQNKSKNRQLKKPGYMDSTDNLFKRCSNGDMEACRLLGVSKPGQRWTQQAGITRNITNNRQLSGKYARYPKETEIHIECLPSRHRVTVYSRNDINAVFLRDGDKIVNSESGMRGLREYGTRFRSIDEAAETLCR